MTVCTDADIVTTTLLAWDDELARRLVELKNSKNAYEDSLAELELKMDPAEIGEGFKQQKQALDLKTKSVDLQIRQIINYKILTWDKKAWAYQKLADEMIKQWRNAWATISLLNKLDASTPMDLESVAKYFMQEGEDVTSAVKRINDNIANVGTAIAEQEKYINSIPTISDAIKQKKTKEEIKKLIQDRAKEDKKNIKEGLTPNNFADPNDEWTVIKNTTDDIDEQYRLWWQYVLGNAIIWKADAWTLRAIKAVYETKDSVGKLTADQIFKIESLDELMARAYTNVNDLVEDGMLRDAFSEKLTQLTAWYKVWSEKRISRQEVDLEYAERLINLNRLAWDWVAFTSIVRHDAVGEAARKMGIKVDNSNRFYKALVDTLKEDTYLDNMTKEGYVKLTDGTQLTVGNMLELVYVATWDRTLPRLLREKTFDEKSILDIGTQVLLWNKTEASRKVLKLINKVKELPSLADSRDLALMTLTWKKVQPNTPKAFFNYRQMYDQSDMLKETKLKADFMDRMANANRAEVDIDWLEDISSSKWDALVKKLKQFEWWYVLVNDSGWLNNAEFKDALNKANEEIKDESKKIQVLYPRQAQMSNFTMDNGKLIFRSIDGQAYRDMMDNISMRTLWEAWTTMEIAEDMTKAVEWDVKAAWKLTDDLEASANAYFASMLGKPDWANPNYRDTLHWILEDTTWIPIKSLRDLAWVDKNKLWKAVDTEFTNAQKTVGKFRNEVTDITERLNTIDNYTLDELKDDVSDKLKGLIKDSAFNDERAPLIKQALKNFDTATTVEEWMMAKGRLLSMANGGRAENFSLDELKSIFRNWSQATEYKAIFFPNQELDEKETAKYVKQINDMIFDWLTGTVAQNLVKMGYSLPLDNVRWVVFDYLIWNINMEDGFVKAFLYKNGLPTSKALMESVMDSAMPTNLMLWYEDELFKLTSKWEWAWYINRIVEQGNPFVPDTYSSLVSLMYAKAWNIADGNEAKYLTSLLDTYSNIVKERLKDWIDFKEAQQLKTELWYALDIFEQDILMPKYGKYLTPDKRAAIRNMKSYVTIVVGKEWDWKSSKALKELLEANNRIYSTFTSALDDVLNKYNVVKRWLAWADDKVAQEEARKFKEKLKDDWAVVENVNWELVIVDAKEQLKDNLDTAPNTIKWLWLVETVDWWIDSLDNNSAYYLNQLVESAKKLDALAKWETSIMYTMDPELNSYRFFNAFRLVNDWDERVPMALVWDILSGNPNLAKYNTMWLNNILKKEIFNGIKSKFAKDWAVSLDELKGIISKTLREKTTSIKQVFNDITKESKYNEVLDEITNQFKKAFMPYTHLKDIPSTSLDWITDVRGRINNALEEQIEAIRESIDAMPDEYRNLLNEVEVTTPTWQTITIQQFLDWKRPNWKEAIFDDEDILVKTADEFGLKVSDSADAKEIEKIQKENIKHRRNLSNQYNEALQAIQNQQRITSEWERKLTSRMLNNSRSTARKFTLTNRLVEATDMVSWLEEEAARMMKAWLLWWKNIITFGRMNREEPLKRLAQVQEAYKRFYTMWLEWVENITPKNEAEEMAKHLCRYFKTIERHLWSADWATWVTTKANINRAFYNIWEVVNNIRSIEWLYALQSAIEQNQILKFFRFSEPWQASYVKEFTRPASARTEDIFGWYREYVTKLPDNIDVDIFNDIFASQFTDTEFKMLYQALSWITYVGWYGKSLNRFLNFVNGSNFIFRFLISYPWQLLTIPQQGIAYFLKQKGFERQLGIEDMSEIDRVRMQYWTLDKAYNEINLFRDTNPDDIASSSYYNRYWTPDISAAYKGAWLELTDDVNDMYGKMMDYQSSWDDMGRLQRSIDAYKDNANNIIDWLFSRNFKNIAFLKAIKENAFMQFGSAWAFEAFMKDNKISQAVKDQLMDAVNASAWRNFRNILWLGFWWLDRAIGWNGMSNIFYWLMQFFNFRWAWWQNIFRNMWETFKSAFKMLPMGTSKEWRNAIATYIATTPEFMNFVDILFNDMQWTWKMVRYQDNGRWSELDNEYDIWDFLEYSVELMNMTSQWWQGINSFWPARPILEAWWPEGSMFASLRNPEVYKDTYWVWAFFNSLGKNAWRNRKPINYAFQAIQALEEGWPEWVQAFLQNQFWKLSFGSLRYMMNEDANDYWFTYEYLPDESWIPSIIRWEWALGSVKSFSYDLSNNNTWTSIQQIFSDGWWDEKKTYLEDVWWGMINSSQAWSSIKNAIKATPYYNEIFSWLWLWNRKSPWSFDSFADVLEKTESGRELLDTWKVNPKTIPQIKTFINQFIDEDGESSNRSAYKPFGENFAEAISNYNQLWHIKWEEAHSWDKETEFMLSQIRYERDSNGNFIEKNWKKVETQLWKDITEYIKLHPTDMDATSIDVSKMIFKWVEDNNDDPNYLLYQSLIWQGMADMYLTNAWNDYQDAWNGLLGWKKAKDKLTKTEAQNSWWYWDNFMKYLSGTKVSWTDVNLVEYLQRLDRKAAMSSYIKMIKDELTDTKDIENIERYVTFYEDQYWNEKTKINSQYASQIEALGWIWDAIDKGDLKMMMWRASSFANTYLKDDETWLVKASAITSLINKIRDTDISPKLKLEMIAALWENHAEFLQTHLPDMIANLWEDAADALLGIVNEHIYEWDWAVNAAIWDAIINWDWDAAKKWGGTSSKFKSALAVTTKLKNWAWTSGNGYGWRTSSTSTAKWVPYTLNIAKLLDSTWGKGYSPKNPEINIRTYKPTIDLSIGKDVTRTTKAPKTQELKKKKVVL